MMDLERQDFSTALARLMEIYGRDPPVERQTAVWFSMLRSFSLETVRNAMRDYVRTGKRAPVPANLVDLCDAGSSKNDTPTDIAELIRRLPIRFSYGAETICLRMIDDHGREKAAELFEESYPGHGSAYVMGI